MGGRLIRSLVAASCFAIAACAIITVNVYFPEKDVKQAYKSLDEMLLKQKKEGAAPPQQPAPLQTAPQQAPPEQKPQGMLPSVPSFSLVPPAMAADDLADRLAVDISSMPEVLKAYDAMNARLTELTALRDAGVIGETNQGLVSLRETAQTDKQPLVKAENEDRKTVITAMAKAILKINKKPETKENMNQVLGKAAATYAETKREASKPGWWVQLANGRWVRK